MLIANTTSVLMLMILQGSAAPVKPAPQQPANPPAVPAPVPQPAPSAPKPAAPAAPAIPVAPISPTAPPATPPGTGAATPPGATNGATGAKTTIGADPSAAAPNSAHASGSTAPSTLTSALWPDGAAIARVEPEGSIPGEIITFYLRSDKSPVTVSGGGFVRPSVVKPGITDSDAPTKTTAYMFTLGAPPAQERGQRRHDSAAKATPQRKTRIVAQVLPGVFPKLAAHHDPHGWRMQYPAGWKEFPVAEPDPANNELIYFQPEQDAPERLAISILPETKRDSAELMKYVMDDAPTQYDVLLDLGSKSTIQCNGDATWQTFRGIDRAQPDTPTKSMVLTFVRNGRGYIISGRSRLADFDKEVVMLRCLMRSFAYEDPHAIPTPPTPPKTAAGHKAALPRRG